jgi:hypothetical protein
VSHLLLTPRFSEVTPTGNESEIASAVFLTFSKTAEAVEWARFRLHHLADAGC